MKFSVYLFLILSAGCSFKSDAKSAKSQTNWQGAYCDDAANCFDASGNLIQAGYGSYGGIVKVPAGTTMVPQTTTPAALPLYAKPSPNQYFLCPTGSVCDAAGNVIGPSKGK